MTYRYHIYHKETNELLSQGKIYTANGLREVYEFAIKQYGDVIVMTYFCPVEQEWLIY